MNEDRGNYIYTYSGHKFYLDDPQIADIDVYDIAHALAYQCRFNGHCPEFYSVAQHSVLVSDLVSKENALWGLLHDASETYLPDVPRPFKSALTNFHDLEERIMLVIAEWAGLSWPIPQEVHSVDHHIVGMEARALWDPIPDWTYWFKFIRMPRIDPWPPAVAEEYFLLRFKELTND
jgi:hypothetical protein